MHFSGFPQSWKIIENPGKMDFHGDAQLTRAAYDGVHLLMIECFCAAYDSSCFTAAGLVVDLAT